MTFAADFETTTDAKNCRVWAWGMLSMDGEDFAFGTQLYELFEYCEYYKNITLYYHNLKFDGQFMLDWLFKHGYEFCHSTEINEYGERSRRKLEPGQFTTSISDMGIFYLIEICLPNGSRVTVKNSVNLIPMELEAIPAAFGLPTQKLSIDYDLSRGEDYMITQDEAEYLRRDCEILRDALRLLRDMGMKRMTTSSNALEDYRNRIGRKQFNRWFPPPYYDNEIRRSYKGGFAYVNPLYRGKDIENGMVLDINSMYPYILREKMLPYGEGKHFTGQYQADPDYPLYTQRLRCIFDLKVGKIPTIQIKNKFSQFRPTEYLYSSNDDEVDMTLTSVDLEVFFDHYDVTVIEWVDGWKFKGGTEMFKEYVDYWMDVKIQGEKDHKPGVRTVAKQMLVGLYGKFGMNTFIKERIPYLDHFGVVQYRVEDPQPKDPIYVPLAAFVTAWGRKIIVEAIEQCGERFLYCDTDSIHLIGWEKPAGLWIDQYALGAFKIERYFEKARYLRPKSYITVLQGELDITCSNLQKRAYNLYETYRKQPERLKLIPKRCQPKVTWDNFRYGTSYYGNLSPKKVNGGMVLEETIFTLSD